MPERERITSDSVSTPFALARTPGEQRAARDAGGRDEDVVARHEVVCREHPIEVEAGGEKRVPLAVVARPETALDRPAEALDRGRRDDTLRRPADSHQHVDARPRAARRDRGGDIAVADQVDAGTRGPKLRDQCVVAVALEHDDGEIAHLHALRRRNRAHVLGGRKVQIDGVGRFGSDRDLVHVHRGPREEHRAALGDRDHGDRAGDSEGCQPRALERVDRHVDLRPEPGAHALVVEEHRRLVLLALTDHDDALHGDRVDHPAHEVDRCRVGSVLVPSADPPGGAHRSRLRHAHELERQVPVRDGRIVGNAHCSTDPIPATDSLTPPSVGVRTTTTTPAQRTSAPPTSAWSEIG